MDQNRTNRVYLIRHGQIKGYENIPVYGHSDVALTETGMLQMEKMAERLCLADLGAIYSSDLIRCVAGARHIARYHNVPSYSLPELRESYFGDWEGLTMEQIRRDYPEELKMRLADLVNYQAPGGGESLADFSVRINDCFRLILKEHEGHDIAIVAHGGVNRVILCNAMGLDLNRMFSIHQDYGLNIIDYFADSNLIRLVNG
jgi:alpha-ribazole phosphatase/probable phosphoglycerate mutase